MQFSKYLLCLLQVRENQTVMQCHLLDSEGFSAEEETDDSDDAAADA